MEPIWALGFMSGTSLDGIDAAFLFSDGENIIEKGPAFFKPYPKEIRSQLKQCLGQASRNDTVRKAEAMVTAAHIHFAKEILQKTPYPPSLIGFHGQTIFHAPPHTLQLGDGQALANATKVPVIYDFRTNDCTHGGQGAPLVPIYHQALCKEMKKPVIILNLGGVSNLTFIDDTSDLIGFDTGPGNALIDDYVEKHWGISYDKGGEIAAQGIPNEQAWAEWLEHPFFKQPYPKSLDRDAFQKLLPRLQQIKKIDAVATLTLFTAKAIKHACYQLPKLPLKMIICGGGAHNITLLKYLRELLPEIEVLTSQAMGWNNDFIEAEAFAFLAIRSFYDLPLSFPLTTGVKVPLTGGRVAIVNNVNFEGGNLG